MSQRKKVSSEVAQQLGLRRHTLIAWVRRNPDCRPAERLPNEDYLWSDAEIEAVVAARATSRPGPKSKKSLVAQLV